MKDTIIMLSTLRRATYYFERFCIIYRDMIIKANKAQLKIKLSTGTTIYFRAKTEGERVLRGFHGEVCSIDDFINQNELRELREIARGKESEDA